MEPEREKSGFLAEMSENQSKIRKTVPKAQNQENQENQSTSDPCNNESQSVQYDSHALRKLSSKLQNLLF